MVSIITLHAPIVHTQSGCRNALHARYQAKAVAIVGGNCWGQTTLFGLVMFVERRELYPKRVIRTPDHAALSDIIPSNLEHELARSKYGSTNSSRRPVGASTIGMLRFAARCFTQRCKRRMRSKCLRVDNRCAMAMTVRPCIRFANAL